MAGSVNKAILIGNLGKDPEVRRMQDGRPVVTLSVATSTSWTDKVTGERKERTHWHRAVIRKDQECKFAESMRKGGKVWIEGAVRSRSYTDKQGVERYVTEVIVDGFGHSFKNLTGGTGGGQGANSPEDYGVDDEYDDWGAPGAPGPMGAFDDEDVIPMGG